MDQNSNRIVWVVIIVVSLILAFKLGADAEASSAHREECVRAGGSSSGLLSEECYFEAEYNPEIRDRLDRSCPTGKGWYIYNDSKTYWRHKCG